MVATRKSLTTSTPAGSPLATDSPALALPTTEGDDNNTPAPANSKVRNALKKLQIDGTAALSGARVPVRDTSQTVETYHCRGAVYEVIPGTRDEWIDKQPKRYLKRGRSRSGVTPSVSGDDGKEVKETTTKNVVGGKRKRISDAVGESEVEPEKKRRKGDGKAKTAVPTGSAVKNAKQSVEVQKDSSMQARAGKKRAREVEAEEEEISVNNNQASSSNINNNVTTHTQLDTPPSKRPRRNQDNYNVSYARPRNITDFTPPRRSTNTRATATTKPAAAPRKGRGSRARNSNNKQPPNATDRMLANDFTVVGGHEELSCIEHARRRAEAMGYQVQPISKANIARSRRLEENMLRGIYQLAILNDKIASVTEKMRENEEALKKAGKWNDALQKRKRESELATVKETREALGKYAPPRTSLLDILPTGVPRDQQISPEEKAALTPEFAPPSQKSASPAPSSTASSSLVEIITSRHDSAASLPPNSANNTTTANNATTTTNTTRPAPVNRPTVSRPAVQAPPPPTAEAAHTTLSRGGHTVRWSLPKQVLEEGRAENDLMEKIKEKLAGESRAARRRRVRREMKLVQSWGVVEDDEAGKVDGTDAVAGAQVQGEGKEGERKEGRAEHEIQLQREQLAALQAGKPTPEDDALLGAEENTNSNAGTTSTPLNNDIQAKSTPNTTTKPTRSKLNLITTPTGQTTSATAGAAAMPPPALSTRSSAVRSATSSRRNSSTTTTPVSATGMSFVSGSSSGGENRRTSSRVEKSKKQVCVEWKTKGECRRGSRCSYAHPISAFPNLA